MYHPDSVVTLHKRILKDAGLTLRTYPDLTQQMQQKAADVKMVSFMAQVR